MFYIKSFLDYLVLERNYSSRTVASYGNDLELFARFKDSLEEGMEWASVDKDVIRRWIVSMMEQGASAASVNRRLSALRSFYRFMMAKKWVQKDPVRLIQGPKKQKALPYFLKESEMDRLLDDMVFDDSYEGVRDRLILCMFYETGIRLSELTGLNLEDVDLDSCQLKVTGKRNKQRIVPFGRELAEMLQVYLVRRAEVELAAQHAALFLSEEGGRMATYAVRACVRFHLSKVTTLKKKTPHVLRHTFATAMLNHGADLEVVKELLGHESLAATEIYTHTTFEELKHIYNNAHPRA